MLVLIMMIALVMEKKTEEIAPALWLVGGLCGFIFQILGWGTCVWWEALVCMVVTLILVIMFVAKYPAAIGGGILKGVIMTAVYVGRYVGITILVLAVTLRLAAGFYSKRDKCKLVLGMPFLLGAVLVTIAVLLVL